MKKMTGRTRRILIRVLCASGVAYIGASFVAEGMPWKKLGAVLEPLIILAGFIALFRYLNPYGSQQGAGERAEARQGDSLEK